MLTLNVILGCQGLLFLDFLWMLYFVLYSWRVCSCHCCWPSSFLPSRVASNRAQGFSSKVDILEICPSCLLPKAGTVFEINVHVIIFPQKFCLLFNLLNPKSDNNESSLYNINALENRVVMRIGYMNQGRWV